MDLIVIDSPHRERYYFAYQNWLGGPGGQAATIEIPASLLDPNMDRKVYKVRPHSAGSRQAMVYIVRWTGRQGLHDRQAGVSQQAGRGFTAGRQAGVSRHGDTVCKIK